MSSDRLVLPPMRVSLCGIHVTSAAGIFSYCQTRRTDLSPSRIAGQNGKRATLAPYSRECITGAKNPHVRRRGYRVSRATTRLTAGGGIGISDPRARLRMNFSLAHAAALNASDGITFHRWCLWWHAMDRILRAGRKNKEYVLCRWANADRYRSVYVYVCARVCVGFVSSGFSMGIFEQYSLT